MLGKPGFDQRKLIQVLIISKVLSGPQAPGSSASLSARWPRPPPPSTPSSLDDGAEDCYARAVEDAVRDSDWEPFENVSDTRL